VPAGVLAEAWRGGPQHRLSMLLKGCKVEDLSAARHAGWERSSRSAVSMTPWMWLWPREPCVATMRLSPQIDPASTKS